MINKLDRKKLFCFECLMTSCFFEEVGVGVGVGGWRLEAILHFVLSELQTCSTFIK
jgi:hypothetical protein